MFIVTASFNDFVNWLQTLLSIIATAVLVLSISAIYLCLAAVLLTELKGKRLGRFR